MDTWTPKLKPQYQVKSLNKEYLGVNKTKYTQDLYTVNYKMLMKEIKDLNKWRDIPCSRIRRFNIVNMQCSPNSYTGLMQFLSDCSMIFFCGYRQDYLKFI